MKSLAPFIVAALLLLPLYAVAQDASLVNPTKRAYTDELVRLPAPAPGEAGSFVVTQDGAEVPYQVEKIEGKDWVWVCADFAPGASHAYRTAPGKPKPAVARVTVKRDGADYLLDSGAVAVKVPAEATAGGIPGPVSAIRLGGKWVGGSAWHTSLPLAKFTATVVGDGTLFGKVRLRYEFARPAGSPAGGQAPFAEVDVAVAPGWQHAEITERHEMGRDDSWEFDASRGWSPKDGVSRPYSSGPGSGEVGGKVEPNRPLTPGGLPVQRPDLYINLQPRWNQHYKDGWYFAATDGSGYVGAVVVRASRWVWPHDNSIQCVVKEGGGYAGLHCPTWHGQRQWWLFAAEKAPAAPADVQYVAHYAWEGLDKLNHEFILDWPGHEDAKKGDDKGGGPRAAN